MTIYFSPDDQQPLRYYRLQYHRHLSTISPKIHYFQNIPFYRHTKIVWIVVVRVCNVKDGTRFTQRNNAVIVIAISRIVWKWVLLSSIHWLEDECNSCRSNCPLKTWGPFHKNITIDFCCNKHFTVIVIDFCEMGPMCGLSFQPNQYFPVCLGLTSNRHCFDMELARACVQ